MRNGILTIFRKELARFFGDRRMAVTTILLPGLLIFVLYSFMGSALADKFTVEDDFVPTVQAVNLPSSVSALAAEAGLDITAAEDEESARALIAEKELNALLVFPAEFDRLVAGYDVSSGIPAPEVALY